MLTATIWTRGLTCGHSKTARHGRNRSGAALAGCLQRHSPQHVRTFRDEEWELPAENRRYQAAKRRLETLISSGTATPRSRTRRQLDDHVPVVSSGGLRPRSTSARKKAATCAAGHIPWPLRCSRVILQSFALPAPPGRKLAFAPPTPGLGPSALSSLPADHRPPQSALRTPAQSTARPNVESLRRGTLPSTSRPQPKSRNRGTHLR